MPYCHYQTFREFVKISPLCYKAIDFDGTEYLVPVSQCFWLDRTPCMVTVLVSDWLIKEKGMKPEGDRVFMVGKGNFDDSREEIVVHVPKRLKPETGVTADESLKR